MTHFTRSLAILIGIDAYTGGIPRLTTAVNDATRLAGLLHDAHGYETVLLTEPATSQPVTREHLRTLFTQELRARLGEDDRLLVYFAGHGVALDGDDGPHGYLVPQDARPGDSATLLAMTDLHAWLTELPCRHMLAILDCCFAGAFRWASTRHIGALPDVIHRERYDRYLRSPAWQVLTSAAYDQKALDVLGGNVLGRREADGRQHSPFAQALIDGLEKGAADLVPQGQGDGVITATELYLYLREQVEVQAEAQASHEQTPGLWPLNKHRKGEFIFLAPGHPLNLPAAPDLTDELNPYRGLKSYDQQHAPLFFGREDEIKELVALVEQQPFLAVLGASGTGKSSLVKAGVLPRLQGMGDGGQGSGLGGQGLGVRGYHVLSPMRPTDRPVRALEMLLRVELGEDPSGLENPKGLGDDALALAITRWAATHPGQRLVLTIDQFEELATLCRDDGERARFLRLLAYAVQAQPDALRLILTLRTDFEPQFTQQDSPLAGLWQAGRYVVPPMDIEDLRQVIEGPASVRVLYFDPSELVDDLIKEVIQTPGALPLLSFTLSELFVKYVHGGRDDRALAGADYQALGGVVGSLRNRATEEYDRLPDDAHRQTMQRVMLRMVAVEGGELARRRVVLSELEYPTTEENARVSTVLDQLVAARLLVRGTSDPSAGSGQASDGTQGEAYVEPAHDALVLAWDKLLRWKQEAEEYLPLQRRLAQAAGEWRNTAPEARSGLLWDNDPRLPQVEEVLWPAGVKQQGVLGRAQWAAQVLAPRIDKPADTTWLNGAELAFVQHSVRARAVFWRRVLGAAALLVLVLLAATTISLGLQQRAVQAEATAVAEAARALNAEGTAVAEATRALNAEATAVANAQIARDKQAEAEREARRARAGELSAVALGLIDQDSELALLVAQEAISVTRTFESEEALRQALRGSLLRAGYMPEDTWLDVVEFAPDGSRLLVTGQNGEQAVGQILAVPSLQPLVELRNPPGVYIDEARFSPNGQQILTVENSGAVSLWDARTGLADPPFQGVGADWSADGSRFAVAAEDGTVDIRRADNGRGELSLPGREGDTAEAVFFAAGDRLIVLITSTSFGFDHQARVLDAATGDVLAEFPLNRGSLAFSADRSLLAHGDGQVVQVRSARDNFAEPVHSVTGHQADVKLTRFSPDRSLVASTADDNSVRVWTLRDPGTAPSRAFVAQTKTLDESALLIEFSPLDGTLLTAGYNGVRGWDVAETRELLSIDPSTLQIDALAVAPDGRTFATASSGQVHLWASRPGEEYVLFDAGQAVIAPDGRRLAVISPDGIRLQAAGPVDPQAQRLSGRGTAPYLAPAFTANSRYLYAVQGPMALWLDAATGEKVGSLDLSGKANGDIVLAPDGAALGGSMRLDGEETRILPVLLDAATGQPRPLAGEMPPYQNVTQIGFSPDGSLFFVNGSTYTTEAGSNRVVRVWDAATGQLRLPRADVSEGTDRFPADGHFGRGTSFVFSPDGQALIMANEHGITIWAIADGARLAEFPAGSTPISAVAMGLSQDGRRLVVPDGFTTTARVWDLTTGAATPLRGHNGVIDTVRISADGSLVLTASGPDGSTRLWNGATGELLTVFPWRMQEVTLSSDGRLVLFSPGAFAGAGSYAQLYLTDPADVYELSKTRVTRSLTCAERRGFLREAIDCPVATPEPVAS